MATLIPKISKAALMNEINPFQVLYVTDSPDPKAFVQLFSDYPVQFSHPIFQPGNVVLKGTQGSGKSMLLNLLRPEIRLAYHNAGHHMPIPARLSSFLSGGINLTLSGALDIGQRPLTRKPEEDEAVFPLLFGDFINYFVVRDLLRSLQLVVRNSHIFDGLVDGTQLDAFASTLARDECWFGYLSNVDSYASLCSAIDARLAAYRSFHQFNSDLSVSVLETKTRIGTPIARMDDVLKATHVIDSTVPLFVRIDQLERLYRSDVLRPALGVQYRRVVNKALGQRDSRVSYRIGTRRYAWEDDLVIYGTDDRLEHLRDFRVVDLDDKMRRKEDSKTWFFPDFAADAFNRRLRLAGYQEGGTKRDLLTDVFGTVPSPNDAARQYVKHSDWDTILRLDASWSEPWRTFLKSLAAENPCSAVLAAAWALQKGKERSTDRRTVAPPTDAPWDRMYWRKERVRQCLMQIAARNGQRLRWSGKDSILSLSTPNISVFLSVCHEIWDAFLRSEQRKSREDRIDPVKQGIGADVQAVGIQTASREWYEKIAEQPHGHDRQRFIDVLGRMFRTWLLNDHAMSNPGHNGFSLEVEALREYPALQKFLQEATDYGDLYDADHTTKSKDRKQRKKWYLSPILSAFFQIPEAHPKEPKYVDVADVAEWLQEANVEIAGLPKRSKRGKASGVAGEGQDIQRSFEFGSNDAGEGE